MFKNVSNSDLLLNVDYEQMCTFVVLDADGVVHVLEEMSKVEGLDGAGILGEVLQAAERSPDRKRS